MAASFTQKLPKAKGLVFDSSSVSTQPTGITHYLQPVSTNERAKQCFEEAPGWLFKVGTILTSSPSRRKSQWVTTVHSCPPHLFVTVVTKLTHLIPVLKREAWLSVATLGRKSFVTPRMLGGLHSLRKVLKGEFSRVWERDRPSLKHCI